MLTDAPSTANPEKPNARDKAESSGARLTATRSDARWILPPTVSGGVSVGSRDSALEQAQHAAMHAAPIDRSATAVCTILRTGAAI
jgi:hypothetical protein